MTGAKRCLKTVPRSTQFSDFDLWSLLAPLSVVE